MSTRKQVNIRLTPYMDDLLNAIVDTTGMSKTDIINCGIERFAMDVLATDVLDQIRLSQYNGSLRLSKSNGSLRLSKSNGSYICKSCKKLVLVDDVDEDCARVEYCCDCYEGL